MARGRVACTRYIRDLEADDLLDITGMLTPQEQTAYTSQPASPPPHSPTAVPPSATNTPLLSTLAPPLLSRLPSPMALPPQAHPLQVPPHSSPWTPLADHNRTQRVGQPELRYLQGGERVEWSSRARSPCQRHTGQGAARDWPLRTTTCARTNLHGRAVSAGGGS